MKPANPTTTLSISSKVTLLSSLEFLVKHCTIMQTCRLTRAGSREGHCSTTFHASLQMLAPARCTLGCGLIHKSMSLKYEPSSEPLHISMNPPSKKPTNPTMTLAISSKVRTRRVSTLVTKISKSIEISHPDV